MSMVVGIDLGTTNSCVAFCKDNQVTILENKQHKRTTPSFVCYSDTGIFVGEEAINRAALNPENGIFDIKRLIGRKYDDSEVQKNKILWWPFEVIKEHMDEPLIRLTQNDKTLKLRPEEVCAEILKKLKQDAVDFLGQQIGDVVITVPAYFTNPQKQATEDAAKIAQLNVLKLISEPTAAALAFTRDCDSVNGRTVLIYDLGGGTFDVSIVKFRKKEGIVIALGGDASLGGRDFDNKLILHCLNVLFDDYDINLEQEKTHIRRHALRRLKKSCEETKKQLSEVSEAVIDLGEFNGRNIEINITRDEFEKLNEPLFLQTIHVLEDVFKGAKISKKQIDDVILVGGSTRIPRIQVLVRKCFYGKSLSKVVNPDEAVAIGAALEASRLSGNSLQNITRTFSVVDVTPFSIGVQVEGNTMSVIIKKNTKIPSLEQKTYKTIEDNQTVIDLCFFEGESKNVEDNVPIGNLRINGITPKKAGKVEIFVVLHLDMNGILTITAREPASKIEENLTISLTNGRLTEEEIARMRENNIFEPL